VKALVSLLPANSAAKCSANFTTNGPHISLSANWANISVKGCPNRDRETIFMLNEILIRSDEGPEYWLRLTFADSKVRVETATEASMASVYFTKQQIAELANTILSQLALVNVPTD
jgi:hypothetical protein